MVFQWPVMGTRCYVAKGHQLTLQERKPAIALLPCLPVPAVRALPRRLIYSGQLGLCERIAGKRCPPPSMASPGPASTTFRTPLKHLISS